MGVVLTMLCSIVMLEAQLFSLKTRKEWPGLAWQLERRCTTFLWLFFLDTARSQKGSERAHEIKDGRKHAWRQAKWSRGASPAP